MSSIVRMLEFDYKFLPINFSPLDQQDFHIRKLLEDIATGDGCYSTFYDEDEGATCRNYRDWSHWRLFWRFKFIYFGGRKDLESITVYLKYDAPAPVDPDRTYIDWLIHRRDI